MGLIVWSDKYSVNIKEIDRQHQRLVGMLGALHQAMKERQGKAVLGGILQEMGDYAVTHFTTEEKHMLKHGFPEYEAHKREHDEFVRKVQKFQADFEKRALTLSIELLDFLSDWLTRHILGTDKKYAPFLNARGVH